MNWIPIKTVLCSVSDKSHLDELAGLLVGMGCRIISSGGTATFLSNQGIPTDPVAEVTGFPEILDGRVKTLHPKIHGGLLALRGDPRHQEQLRRHGICPLDMVIVNLYPFVDTVSRTERTLSDVFENIDIGGPAMIRSAAKNFESVAVVCDPSDYPAVIAELQGHEGSLCLSTRLRLARKAFSITSGYDGHVRNFLHRLGGDSGAIQELDGEAALAPNLSLNLESVNELRYGENPHQKAILYRETGERAWGLAGARILQGKAISYNNLLDLDAALGLVGEFREPAAALIKHTNPCGAACGTNLSGAYESAYACDPLSAFGCVIALNREVDEECARAMVSRFVEVIAAPRFSPSAREILHVKKNLRLLELPDDRRSCRQLRSIAGGILVQEEDVFEEDPERFRVVSKRQPTEKEWEDLRFAWKVAKHVKSNAIVLARDHATTGVGAGQMSRVESVELAVGKAGTRANGSVLASDAFFPFPDGIESAARAGVTAAIQPGGSRRDREVIDAADEHGMAVVFTGMRHFRH